MPVSLSLEVLVSHANTRSIWPSEFAAFITNLEKEPDDATQWLVFADWLKDHEEYGLEDACRWLVKHVEVSAVHSQFTGWSFQGLPMAVGAGPDPDGNKATLAGALAMLAARLRRAREQVA